MKNRLKTLMLAAAIAAFTAAPAFAASPDCSASGVLSAINSRFDYAAAHYLHRDLAITELQDIHENRFEGRDETHAVERVYCHAKAAMNDGRKRDLWYLLERNWGFAGIGQHLELCVSGLDPWYLYGRNCRSLR